MTKRNRPILIQIYLNEDEKIILDEKVRLSGSRNISTYIRHLIKYGLVYDVDYSNLSEMNYQLGKIGSNINQIAHIANASENISQNQINQIKEEMQKIWHIQESILSRQPFTRR